MNEEKLNKIFIKLLDIEAKIDRMLDDKSITELEHQKKEIEHRLEDVKYVKEKRNAIREDEMAIFRNINKGEMINE